MCQLPEKPNSPEEVYAELDEVFGWGVFGLNSGFCYCQPQGGQEAAETKVKEMNNRFNKYKSDKMQHAILEAIHFAEKN